MVIYSIMEGRVEEGWKGGRVEVKNLTSIGEEIEF